MDKPTINEISSYIDKNTNTISGWNTKQPKLLELVKIGAFCKKNDISLDMIKNCIELKELSDRQRGE